MKSGQRGNEGKRLTQFSNQQHDDSFDLFSDKRIFIEKV